MERTAVRLERQMDAVPVHSRRFRQIVLEMDDDEIALAHVERRSRHMPVVSEYFACHAWLQRKFSHRRGEVYFDGARAPGDVDEQRRIRRVGLEGGGCCGCVERLPCTRGRDESGRQYKYRH